ncbi:phage tail assembly chaperone [Pseudorhizobium tarimense]|uniref:phage tail assembly chaperone n=1 Tax=Pseudorhizobium tarimense TaxID=1079109 RepID=UPI003F4A35E1
MAYATAFFLPRRRNDPPPEEPEFGLHIWGWFIELHNTRQSGFSANPITYSEIESFCRLSGAIISPWELSVIRSIDAEVLSVINKTGGHKREAATEADVAESKQRIRAAAKNRRVVKRETT